MSITRSSNRRDASTGLYFVRELETILTRVNEVEYADIKYPMLIPVSNEVNTGADSFTYRVFDKVGSMKIIGDRASDLPRSDVQRKEVTFPVRSLGASFAYTIQEVRAAALVPGMSLEMRRAEAVRRAYEEKMQEIAYFGEPASGMRGLFNSPSIDRIIPDKWFDTVGITTDEMLEILNEPLTRIVQNSNLKEYADTLLVPYNVYRIISTRQLSTTRDTTVMEFFMRTNPMIQAIEPINELEASKSSSFLSKDRILAYKRDPAKLEFHIPQPLEFLPPERRGLEYQVAAHARVGGVSAYYPKSMQYIEKP